MSNVSERKLDRRPQFDVRSRAYAIVNEITERVPVDKVWRPATNVFLDQGSEGACVGNGWTYELGSTPIRYKIDQALTLRIYNEARKLDEWEGEDYSGTSVLAGAKAVQSFGFVQSYKWAFGLHDVLLALSYKGPVVLGVNWYSKMFDTDAAGFIRVAGDIKGGHCIIAHAIDTVNKTVTLRNSWGKDWGGTGSAPAGSALLTWADLERLLAEQGEACIATDKSQRGVIIFGEEDDKPVLYETQSWWETIVDWFRNLLHIGE